MIRRIRQTDAEAVTDLWDEACGGVLEERGRRNIAAMLVLAASSHRGACFVDDGLNGFVLAELAEDGLLPGRFGRVEELYARDDAELERALVQAAVDWLWQHEVFVIRTELELGESAEVVESLGFGAETTRFGLYRESSTSNCTSSP
jgi:hypothetical protein